MTILDTAVQAARAAGLEIARRLPQERDVRVKGFRDIVTDADMAAQTIVADIIRSRYPDHGILSEEGLRPGSEGTVWVLDPLDGTTNYSHRFPNFSVSVAVAQEGAPVIGVVYDPLRDHVFAAERGAGATLNGEPIHISDCSDVTCSLTGFDLARAPAVRAELMAILTRCSTSVRTFRSLGSAALGLCYVAAGWLEAYFHFGLKAWDCAAGGLIVSEAGGTITGPQGEPWNMDLPRCLATNGQLHPIFLDMFREAREGMGSSG